MTIKTLAVGCALALIATACGGEDDESSAGGDCREAAHACASGYACVQSGSAFTCQPTGGTGSGTGTGTGTGGGSGCADTTALTVDYLSACSSQEWIVYDDDDGAGSCFNGTTFEFSDDLTEIYYDNCLGTTREDVYSVEGDVLTLHGYQHRATIVGNDFQLTYIGGSSSPNTFKIRKSSGPDTCSQPAVTDDYLSDCSSQRWVVSGATNACFNQSTFEFSQDGTEVHFDNCLGTTLTDTYEIQGDVITLHGYDHQASVSGANLVLTYIGGGSPNTFTLSKVD